METPKYYKHKDDEVIVEWLREIDCETFKAKVVVNDSTCAIGKIYTCSYVDFLPHELNTATLANDTPQYTQPQASDTDIRLKCLELASRHNNHDALDMANEFYDWVTKTTKQ